MSRARSHWREWIFPAAVVGVALLVPRDATRRVENPAPSRPRPTVIGAVRQASQLGQKAQGFARALNAPEPWTLDRAEAAQNEGLSLLPGLVELSSNLRDVGTRLTQLCRDVSVRIST